MLLYNRVHSSTKERIEISEDTLKSLLRMETLITKNYLILLQRNLLKLLQLALDTFMDLFHTII